MELKYFHTSDRNSFQFKNNGLLHMARIMEERFEENKLLGKETNTTILSLGLRIAIVLLLPALLIHCDAPNKHVT